MTQAFNLSQLANNLDPSGKIDAADGLVNATPITNGGTGATSAAAARTNLAVPSTGGTGATGTWPISISGTAGDTDTLQTTDFKVFEQNGKLMFQYQGNNIASLDQQGNFTALANVSAFTTP